MAAESKTAIYAAIIANFAIAIAKFTAAAFTGSSAMISEGIHSVVDTGNGGLLLMGMRASKKPPDARHPFGYGKELYFWSLIVAVVIFAAGGGVSIYEGVLHLLHPAPLQDPTWNYVVLGLAAVFESIALVIAYRQFRKQAPADGLWRAIRKSKDPTTFSVLFEDAAALLGLAAAFAGVYLGHRFNNPHFDGGASVAIGVILCGVAVLLARECKGLLVGEGAEPEVLDEIRRIAEADPSISEVKRPLTMHFGPSTVLLTLDAHFRGGLSGDEIGAAVNRIERSIRKAHPEISHIFVESAAIGKHKS